MNLFYKICIVLIIIGGINWGLIGLFGFDAVAWLLGGSASLLSRTVGAVRHPQPVRRYDGPHAGGGVTAQAAPFPSNRGGRFLLYKSKARSLMRPHSGQMS